MKKDPDATAEQKAELTAYIGTLRGIKGKILRINTLSANTQIDDLAEQLGELAGAEARISDGASPAAPAAAAAAPTDPRM